VWLYEAVPYMGQLYGQTVPGFAATIPRILRWTNSRVPTEGDVRTHFQIRRAVSHHFIVFDCFSCIIYYLSYLNILLNK
jgi:hypothetical protein